MNLSNNIDFDIKHFFLWWGRELSYWMPENIRQALSDKTGYIFMSATTEKLSFNRISDEQNKTIAELDFNDKSQEQYQKLLTEDDSLEHSRFILRLNSEQAIHKILYLPAAAKENLKQVVTFEIDRYTPFSVEQVYFSVKQLEKEQHGQIKVLLVITPKDRLDAIFQQLKKIPIYPEVVDYELAANNFADDLDPYNLLPEGERPLKNKISQYTTAILSISLLLLLGAILAYPVWSEGKKVESLRNQLKLLKNDASLVQSRQLEMDEMVAETERLIQVKLSTPSVTELTNILSKLIPGDTWLTHLRYSDGRLQIQGQSPAASALIGILEGSPLFSNARFVSPLTQDKRTGMERFQISVEVKAREVSNDK